MIWLGTFNGIEGLKFLGFLGVLTGVWPKDCIHGLESMNSIFIGGVSFTALQWKNPTY